MSQTTIFEKFSECVSGIVNVAGNNTIIPAPGLGRRLIIHSFVIQNESAVATTMILQQGAVQSRWRVLAQNQGDGLSKTFDTVHPWELTDNTPLVLNLSGANQCNYSVLYTIK